MLKIKWRGQQGEKQSQSRSLSTGSRKINVRVVGFLKHLSEDKISFNTLSKIWKFSSQFSILHLWLV